MKRAIFGSVCAATVPPRHEALLLAGKTVLGIKPARLAAAVHCIYLRASEWIGTKYDSRHMRCRNGNTRPCAGVPLATKGSSKFILRAPQVYLIGFDFHMHGD